MDEIFKALNSFKSTPASDNFYIEVKNKEIISLCREPNNNTVKISQQDYKFLLDKGIEYFIYDHGIIKKPKKKTERVFDVLKKDVRGYNLENNDPYWPTDIIEGGYTWQTPSE
jgi:non-homologous end joining protein Ku